MRFLALLTTAVHWFNPLCYLVHRWTRKMVRQAFGGSVADLVVAFTGGKKLSPEDAEQIKKLI